jgi:hypothetical protein
MATQYRMTCTGCGGFAGYGYTQYSVCHNCNVKADQQHRAILKSSETDVSVDISDEQAIGIFRVIISLIMGGAVAYYCNAHNWLIDSNGRAGTLFWVIFALWLGYRMIVFRIVKLLVELSLIGAVIYGVYYWVTSV